MTVLAGGAKHYMREFTHLQVYTKLGVGRGAEVCVCERARALLSRWREALHARVYSSAGVYGARRR